MLAMSGVFIAIGGGDGDLSWLRAEDIVSVSVKPWAYGQEGQAIGSKHSVLVVMRSPNVHNVTIEFSDRGKALEVARAIVAAAGGAITVSPP